MHILTTMSHTPTVLLCSKRLMCFLPSPSFPLRGLRDLNSCCPMAVHFGPSSPAT